MSIRVIHRPRSYTKEEMIQAIIKDRKESYTKAKQSDCKANDLESKFCWIVLAIVVLLAAYSLVVFISRFRGNSSSSGDCPPCFIDTIRGVDTEVSHVRNIPTQE